MKVLQTLGRHSQAEEGIFAYRRTVKGVEISAMGTANLNPKTVVITHDEWATILKAVSGDNLYRLSESSSGDPPKAELHVTIMKSFKPNGWAWETSRAAYVAAILEHEGSVDLYGGGGGPGVGHPIVLAEDVN